MTWTLSTTNSCALSSTKQEAARQVDSKHGGGLRGGASLLSPVLSTRVVSTFCGVFSFSFWLFFQKKPLHTQGQLWPKAASLSAPLFNCFYSCKFPPGAGWEIRNLVVVLQIVTLQDPQSLQNLSLWLKNQGLMTLSLDVRGCQTLAWKVFSKSSSVW